MSAREIKSPLLSNIIDQKPEFFTNNPVIKINEPANLEVTLNRPDLVEYSMKLNSKYLPNKESHGSSSSLQMTEVVQHQGRSSKSSK